MVCAVHDAFAELCCWLCAVPDVLTAWWRSKVAGSLLPGYNSVVMVAHTVPGALLVPESTDTRVQPWG
eukprot:COSAG01_NODE_4359_length_5103_cov_11.143685_5_plen_68_part_00